jgi:hypothetical protein
MLVMIMTMLMEYLGRVLLHGARAYIVLSALVPIVLTVAARSTGYRWAATAVAGFYTLFNIGLVLILPLFPAEPKLGPVYQHVTHFIPEAFPILLIVPAFALDLLWNRYNASTASGGRVWRFSLVSAAVFLVVLLAVEWPFADFLMSPAARNRFFGAAYFWYGLPPTSYLARGLFFPSNPAAFWPGILLAFLVAALAFRFGASRGEWLRTIKR